MRLLFGIVVVILVLGNGPLAVAQQYANAVTEWHPGGWDVYSLDLVTSSPCVLTTRALDLNDILGAPNGKFVSLGATGTIILRIPDLVDTPGPDLAVWLNCYSGCRELQIRVSGNGTAFIGVDTILSPAAYREINIDFFPEITPVRYVMIQDTGSCSGGAVIDAVAGLQNPVAVRPTTWGSIKALYQ